LTSAAPAVTACDEDRCRCGRGVRGRLDPSGFRAVRCSLRYCFTAPVTARMVRATKPGSSIIGTWLTPGRGFDRCLRNALGLAVCLDGKECLFLPPCDGDRAWQRVQRCDLPVGGTKVGEDCAIDALVNRLQGPVCGDSISVPRDVAQYQPTHRRRLVHEGEDGTNATSKRYAPLKFIECSRLETG